MEQEAKIGDLLVTLIKEGKAPFLRKKSILGILIRL